MFRVLRFSAQTTLAEVVRAIRRAPALRIALVFPPGVRSRFADTGRMETLVTVCRESHKEATIVGGDELLRACAVACGLRAAVTLDDWRETHPRRTPRRAQARGSASRVAKATTRKLPELVVVPAQAIQAIHEQDGDEASDWLDLDPPDHIQELLALHGRMLGPLETLETLAGREAIALRRPVAVAPRMATVAYDLDPDDLPRSLAEDDEERVTATIRQTSGLDGARLAQGWVTSSRADTRDGDPAAR